MDFSAFKPAIYFVIISAALMSCQGKLTKEQRQAMQEAREQREIKRLTDQEIVQAAYEAGRSIRKVLEAGASADSLLNEYDAQLREYHAADQPGGVEAELWEAYQSGMEAGEEIGENVQRDYPDFLYYTYPLIQGDTLSGMISIRLSRKQIIVNQ